MTTAKAKITNKDVSTKAAIEIANVLRGQQTEEAKQFLQQVIKKEKAVPYKRFTDGVGHKKGMASGRYPVKAGKAFLTLIESAEANAENQDLFGPYTITTLKANKGPKTRSYGRQRGRTQKNTHIDIEIEEIQ